MKIMNTKMIDALNGQIEMEAFASYYYLSMASWCDHAGLEGCAQFFFRQSAEENEHMMRIFNYLLEVDARAIVPATAQPPADFTTIQDIFKKTYQHEQKVTASINNLVDIAKSENDNVTYNFLQWFVDEQREEEALMRSIQDKLNLIGEGPQSLYFIDKEIDALNTAEIKAAEQAQ